MKCFRGLCIDGPRDGKKTEHTAPWLRIAVLPTMTTADYSIPVDPYEPVLIEHVVYRWVPFRCGGQTVGFWLADAPDDDAEAGKIILEKLTRRYEVAVPRDETRDGNPPK